MTTTAKKKMVQWEPTDIKEEMLAKYPPKVARKRAKQIMINEAQEKTTPEIVANVRTIPGIITMRGCTYAGCKGVIMGPVSDVVNLVHGPIGCSLPAGVVCSSRSLRSSANRSPSSSASAAAL